MRPAPWRGLAPTVVLFACGLARKETCHGITIDDVLSPWPPASCNTPVLLIRNAANLNWLAAGILKF
jgi:hypothetical protein